MSERETNRGISERQSGQGCLTGWRVGMTEAEVLMGTVMGPFSHTLKWLTFLFFLYVPKEPIMDFFAV